MSDKEKEKTEVSRANYKKIIEENKKKGTCGYCSEPCDRPICVTKRKKK